MPEVFTKQKRSEIMSKIRSKNTKIELKMKKALETNGIEYVYQPRIFGRPDFLIPPDIVVFCDGSFWHGRNWNRLRKKLAEGYWREHIKRNRNRDRTINRQLERQGYAVLRFWDDQIEKEIGECLRKIRESLQKPKKLHMLGVFSASTP